MSLISDMHNLATREGSDTVDGIARACVARGLRQACASNSGSRFIPKDWRLCPLLANAAGNPHEHIAENLHLTDQAGTGLDFEQAAAMPKGQAGITVLPVGVLINHSQTEGSHR